jgi:uncharacterized protein YfdQ (DUF2303 family)
MDHTAIQEIADQSAAKAFNAAESSLKAIPNNCTLHDILLRNGERRYFKGLYSTDSLDSYVNYVNENQTENAELFIDKNDMKAKAIFDLYDDDGTPRTAEHRAIFEAQASPEFMAINALLNARQISQEEIVEFAEDWGDTFIFIDTTGEDVSPIAAINSLRNMRVTAKSDSESSVTEMTQSRSRTANIEAKGRDVTVAGFKGKIPIYNELPEKDVIVKFRLHVKGDEFSITARQVGRDKMKEDVAFDLQTHIQDRVEVKSYIGRITT